MALSLVGSVLQNQSTGTSATLQIPTLTTGDLVVVWFEVQSSSATVTPHTGFTQRGPYLTLAGTTQGGFYAWAADTSASNYDVTFSHNGASIVINMEVWVWHSSIAAFTSSAIDKSNSASGSGTSIQTGTTGTLSQTVEVALAAAITATNNGGTEAIDSGFTIRSAATHNRCVLGDLVTAATTALNPTLSWATSLTDAAVIVTFPEPATATNAAAGNATSTGTANAATTTIAAPAASSTATGTAAAPTTSIAAAAGAAAAAGTANAATTSVAASAGSAAATAAAFDAIVTTTMVAPAGQAAATGTAYGATVRVSAPAPTVTAAGTGYDASVSTETPPYARIVTGISGPWPAGSAAGAGAPTAAGDLASG